MSDWQAVCAILRAEAPDQAERIEARLLHELGGERVYLPRRAKLTRADVLHEVRRAAGRVDLAAARLKVSKATVYRKLQPQRPEPGPRMAGRLVR